MDNRFLPHHPQILGRTPQQRGISRRRFTQMAALLVGAAPVALRVPGPFAQSGDLVFVN